MFRLLRPVGLDFIEVAPTRLVFSGRTTAAPEHVYRALAEEVEGWPSWFRAVTGARPMDGGAGRAIRLAGGVRFEETIMAADPERRYAYRVDKTNAPGLRALLEEWRLTPSGSGTHVQWTFAADGPPTVRLALAAARPALGHSFRTAVRALDLRLAARGQGTGQ